MRRGEVWWAELEPRSGSQQRGRYQVTTLDRAKLIRRVGTLPAALLRDLEAGLRAALDLG